MRLRFMSLNTSTIKNTQPINKKYFDQLFSITISSKSTLTINSQIKPSPCESMNLLIWLLNNLPPFIPRYINPTHKLKTLLNKWFLQRYFQILLMLIQIILSLNKHSSMPLLRFETNLLKNMRIHKKKTLSLFN